MLQAFSFAKNYRVFMMRLRRLRLKIDVLHEKATKEPPSRERLRCVWLYRCLICGRHESMLSASQRERQPLKVDGVKQQTFVIMCRLACLGFLLPPFFPASIIHALANVNVHHTIFGCLLFAILYL